MAKEVIEGEYDSSADIYSVGCTVLPDLTHRVIFFLGRG